MLYKSKVEYEDYACNHVQGCSHGCLYPCYAFLLAKRYGRVKSYEDWLRPQVKPGYLAEVRRDIKRLKGKIQEVHLCFMTDVFMYKHPEVISASLDIIREFKKNNIRFKTLTKGAIPYEAIIEIEKNEVPLDMFESPVRNSYGISLVSLDEEFRQKWEPFACPYSERISALEKVAQAGLDTYVYMEPFSPADTSPRDFKILLNHIRFVKKIIFGSWQYNGDKKADYGVYMGILNAFCQDNGISLKVKKEVYRQVKVLA